MKRFLGRYPWISRFVFSFPVQLVMLQLKKNLIHLLFWVILFGFVTQQIAAKYGIPFLFLNPEYLSKVNFWSYLIMGFSCGGFIMAFNISSYIINSFRFPFLATLSNPFLKYCLNNFILPFVFAVVYCIKIYQFQTQDQLISITTVWSDIIGFLLGIFAFIFLSISYFFSTNKDLFKMFGIKTSDVHFLKKKTKRVVLKNNLEWKKLVNEDREWRVDTYLGNFNKIRLTRGVEHYDKEMLIKVFRQNHYNAAVFEVITIVTLLTLGLFREIPVFAIPAGSSIILLFTMYLMLTSAIHNWLRGWSTSFFIALLIAINLLFQYNIFHVSNNAFGMNYAVPPATYNYDNLKKYNSNEKIYQEDVNNTLAILEKWKAKNTNEATQSSLPKLILINTSGGGLRSALWTFHALQYADSLLDGKLIKQTQLITGSSGGMIGASYFRELYQRHIKNEINNLYAGTLKENIAKDILNPIAFSIAVNDLFVRLQRYKLGDYTYTKDRAYAFEAILNENTGYVMNKKLKDYTQPEADASIPMMIFTPSIVNDGRKLYISSQPVSYLTQALKDTNIYVTPITEGIEFLRFFALQDAGNLQFTSALRMNATFPYITPMVSLPSEPVIEIADAGARDNYGLETSLKFLYTFRNWINANTSGIIILQIRDRRKEPNIEENTGKTLSQNLSTPINSLYTNLFHIQDYTQSQLLQYSSSWLKKKMDVIDIQLRNENTDRISLSWHLTNKEKAKIIRSIYLPENQKALERLKSLLNPTQNTKEAMQRNLAEGTFYHP